MTLGATFATFILLGSVLPMLGGGGHFFREGALTPEAKAMGVVLDYDTPPRAIKMPRPSYPRRAFAQGIEGTVVLEIVIDREGRVAQSYVRQSIPPLDAAARSCVKKWIFAPARKAGQPVAIIADAPVTFQLSPAPAFSQDSTPTDGTRRQHR